MNEQDLIEKFKHRLHKLQIQQAKYKGKFTPEDEDRTLQAFQLALENPSLSESLLFEVMSGERG